MRHGMHRVVLAVAALAIAGLATAAQANSFTDGGFAGFTGGSGTCSGGTYTQQATNSDLPGWSVNSGYTFILNTGNYGSFSNSFGNSNCIGLQPTITAPPIGSVFLSIDPSFENNSGGGGWSIAQIVTGLIPGATYNVTFDMAAAQQSGFSGATTDTWLVGLSTGTGGCPTSTSATCQPNTGTTTSGSSQTIPLPGGGFSGWAAAEVTLVANAAAEVLWFYGESTANSSQPPFLLLDGANLQIPEPPAYGMLMVGLLALMGVRRVLRRKA
jgi:hypothetical protein